MALLSIRGLNVFYGSIRAVKNISFEVEEGQIITLIGANGAGKTSILHAVSGLIPSASGEIVFDGHDLKKLQPHRIVELGLAQVPEGRHIFQQMTVEENLEMGAFTMPKDSIADAKERVFSHFPRLAERRRQIGGTLSGGEQQMLAMGRALMSKPKLLMLDEPSMGLAPILVEEIFSIISELHKGGATILLVEQNARMALSVANRGYVLETGKIVKSAPAQDLLHDDAVQKAYLGG